MLINRYFRSGAPPVINPLLTSFPRDTIVPGSFAVTLTWTLPNRTTGAFNVTSPLPGDWFLAAHLPKDEGKISVKVRPVESAVRQVDGRDTRRLVHVESLRMLPASPVCLGFLRTEVTLLADITS